MVATYDAEVDPGRVREQHEDQRDLGQTMDEAVVDIQVGDADAETGIADDESKCGEEHWPGHQRCLETPRDEAEQDHARRDNRETVGVHQRAYVRRAGADWPCGTNSNATPLLQ